MTPEFAYFVLGVIVYQIAKMLWQIAHEAQAKRRHTIFIKQVRIMFPDAEPIQIITVAGSDKQAMENVERKLRDQADLRSA